MVYWKSAFGLGALLRVSQYPQKPITKLHTTIRFTAAQKSSATYVPTDDGDHDPTIDLITLRRRTIPNEFSRISRKRAPESEDEKNPNESEEKLIDQSDKNVAHVSAPPASAASTPSIEKQSRPRVRDTKTILKLVDQLANAVDTSQHQASKPILKKNNQREGQDSSKGSASTPHDRVDPHLVQYLKSVHPKPLKHLTSHDSSHTKPSRQDLDIEFLRPDDIRSNYLFRSQSVGSESKNKDINSARVTSGAAGYVSEHLVDADIQHLKLTSSGANVVIPRPILVKLIEQTISLSGAAVHGDDVVIERYSPTWHRFARLLRTSDLHKISTLKSQISFQASSTQNATGKKPDQIGTVDSDPGKSAVRSIPQSAEISTPSLTEREYIILTLDTKKKRVVATRFRRLLDLSSNVPISSSEDLLNVENLNMYTFLQTSQLTVSCRYLPDLKHLDLEGFYITAARKSGIVLSRKLAPENLAGTHTTGWLQRFLKRM